MLLSSVDQWGMVLMTEALTGARHSTAAARPKDSIHSPIQQLATVLLSA